MEIPGGGGSNVKPSEMENPRGWGVKLEKPSTGGMDIFWNHTLQNRSGLKFAPSHEHLVATLKIN